MSDSRNDKNKFEKMKNVSIVLIQITAGTTPEQRKRGQFQAMGN